MAGTIPGFSLAQQLDSDGTPLVGCKLYTIQAGTTSTPQTAYQDSGLLLPWSYPVLGDAYGRLPQIFLADGSIKLRLTRANGTQVFALDGVLVVGPSSGGGGGSTVDATTVLATGDVKYRYGTGTLTGFVRANGRTLGSATSGATERANADTQVLFEYLWNTDPNLAVSAGRGATSAADWAANKTIALPDARGLALVGLDDMGNAARGIFTGVTFSAGSAITLGGVAGSSRTTLVTANLPPYTPAGSVSVASVLGNVIVGSVANFSATSGANLYTAGNGLGSLTQATLTSTGTLTGTAQGGTSTPATTMTPSMVITVYLKL